MPLLRHALDIVIVPDLVQKLVQGCYELHEVVDFDDELLLLLDLLFLFVEMVALHLELVVADVLGLEVGEGLILVLEASHDLYVLLLFVLYVYQFSVDPVDVEEAGDDQEKASGPHEGEFAYGLGRVLPVVAVIV